MHAPFEQPYGAQLVTGESTHAPVPLQCFALMPLPEQTVAHVVLVSWRWHAPRPSQAPLVPQVEGAVATQASWGSVPAAAAPQTPSAPVPFRAAVHATQAPVQELLQQTPSRQYPERHVGLLEAAPLQGAPLAPLGMHTPPEQ